MKEKLYFCNMCDRSFSRKSNAFRHNSNIHHNLATIIRNSPRQLNYKLGINNKHAKQSKQTKRINSKYRIQKENYLYQDDYFDDFTPDIDDLKIYKILGQLIKPYLELEKEIRHLNPILIPGILSDRFISSLNSSNPVKSLSGIAELYRSMRALDIIATNMQKSKGMFKEAAIVNIKESIRNCSLFDRMNN